MQLLTRNRDKLGLVLNPRDGLEERDDIRIMRVSKFPSIYTSRRRFHCRQRSAMVVPYQHWRLSEQNQLFAAILKILVLAINSKQKKVDYCHKHPHHDPYCLLKSTVHQAEPGNRFSPIGSNAIWDQHFRFSRL